MLRFRVPLGGRSADVLVPKPQPLELRFNALLLAGDVPEVRFEHGAAD